MNRQRMLGILGAAVALLAPMPSALAADSVTLRLDWVIDSRHAPIYLAQAKGFFKDEGIEVKIFPGEGSTVTIKLVGNRSADFGYAAADTALTAYSKGLPVVSTAVILQKNPTAIVFPKSRPITKLEDLYGKRLGTQIKSVVHQQWEAVTRLNKIDRKKITEIPSDRAVAASIAAEKLDAGIAFFFNDALQLEAKGTPMEWLLFSDLGLQVYSSALLTHEAMLKEKPDLVRRFTRAFVKGWSYSMAHPDEAVAEFVKANSQADQATSKLRLKYVMSLVETDDSKKNGIGYTGKAGWEAMQKALLDMKLMEAPIDVTRAFTNEFLK